MNKIKERHLKLDGWIKQEDGLHTTWNWGKYTTKNNEYLPILKWNEDTKEMTIIPFSCSVTKTITTVEAMQKMMDLSSFLLSTES